jgi:outer membrane protein OmpA-like peptidoglycan-associated protein
MSKTLIKTLRLTVVLVITILISGELKAQSKDMAIYRGDNYYKIQDYHNALINYLFVINDTAISSMEVLPYDVSLSSQKLDKKSKKKDPEEKVSKSDYVNHQIAMCYWKTNDYTKAEEHFIKTQAVKAYPEDTYRYGYTLMNNEKYDDAMKAFEKFLDYPDISDSLSNIAISAISGCFYAKEANENPSKVEIWLADTSVFNKGTSSFGVKYFGREDRVTFTSARDGGVIYKPEQESKFLCDVYWAEKENDSWKPAENFGRPMNSAQHDAAACWDNNSTLFYSRWSDESRPDVKIQLIRMKNFLFYESFELPEPVNVAGYKSKQPYVSTNGRELFFSSDRPGGMGGFDIWVISLDSLGNIVGDAKNLGPNVNTELDEVTPFMHETSSTLFFSSKGHNSIGGFDVFKSRYKRSTKSYEKPKNMGVPLNSSGDDTYLVWDYDLKNGFLSSDREPCENGHCYNIYEVTNEPIIISLNGNSYVDGTGDKLEDVQLIFKDVDGEFKSFNMLTDNEAYYDTLLKYNQEIYIKAKKEGYFADAAIVSTKNITSSTVLNQDFKLKKIPNKEIEIKGIEYDFNSANLRDSSKIELDILIEFLTLNNDLSIEIRSHTDQRGSDAYNLTLSEARAKSVVDYLIENGIDSLKLKPKGYGETKPAEVQLADKTMVFLTKEYIGSLKTKREKEIFHQRNRRTAFKVLSQTK